MLLNIYGNYEKLSTHIADVISETIKNNPAAVLCLATGDTPRRAYQLLAKKVEEKKADFTRCTFIALDEWVGIPPENAGSCRYFLENEVFAPLNIMMSQVYLFDGMSRDLAEECKKMDNIIAANGGIDLMLAGVGMNGHIGFNEPGISPGKYAHVAELDEVTQSVGQKYFTGPVTIKQGITLGLQHILQSKKLIVIANGAKKAGIIKKVVEGEVSSVIPAGIVRKHPDGAVMIDAEAADLLEKETAL